MAYLQPCVTPTYSERCHIQNSGIFKIYSEICQSIFCHFQNAVYCWHVENPAIVRILPCLGPKTYSESCFHRHIQICLGIIDNDSYNKYNNINSFWTPSPSRKGPIKKRVCPSFCLSFCLSIGFVGIG